LTALFSLDGLNALVIGGSSGIGNQIARGFQQAGARVAIAGLPDDKLAPALKELQAVDASARGYGVDATVDEDLDRVVDTVIGELGHIDVLVPCQGFTILKPAEEFTAADYDALMATNLRSVFFSCTRVGRHMLARGRGAIINIGSMSAHRGFPLAAIYAMSKHGIVGMTMSLAAEWAARGVRVNAISPGFFMTSLNRDRMSPERKDSAIRRTPAGRFGRLEELVGAAVFLASPAAEFVTGAIIPVDGGYLASGI
jgi:NAD(P)-dependent dehydrogenase (short-subunit alcohol dehydrogenase family)